MIEKLLEDLTVNSTREFHTAVTPCEFRTLRQGHYVISPCHRLCRDLESLLGNSCLPIGRLPIRT